MGMLEELPARVTDLIASCSTSQFVTVSKDGMPIDTPVLYFPSRGLKTIDLATGLSYPAKAERARRNPKVGLYIAGGPDEPVVALRGMAAVRDADLQANADRYLTEASYTLAHNPTWELAHKAVWYWTRMIVEVSPVSIDWWDNASAMEQPPHHWQAPESTAWPASDPAPAGSVSKGAQWRQPPWQELAGEALERGDPAYLSVIDEQGFPRPAKAMAFELTGTGFDLFMPKGLPWAMKGKACLTFRGIETFLGEVSERDGRLHLAVERTLPVFPMTTDMKQLWEPTEDTRSQLMARLLHETERRGQPIPVIPEERPAPTEYYRLRMERMQRQLLPAGQSYGAAPAD